MTRHYYAIRYAYDGATSDGDALARFASHAERRQFCERFPQWEPVTLASIRHRFDVAAFDDRDRHEPAEDASTPARIYTNR